MTKSGFGISIFVLGKETEDGRNIFAKNSNGDPNKACNLVYFPPSSQENGEISTISNLKISQVNNTNGILISQKYGEWGGDMGSNEFGVTIGNEKIVSNVNNTSNHPLSGEELVRIALERSKTAKEALKIITQFISEYGQSVFIDHSKKDFLQNSFIIGDREEGFILETVDKEWIYKRVEKISLLSNYYSIEKEWEECSDSLFHLVNLKNKSLKKSNEKFHFANCFSKFSIFSNQKNIYEKMISKLKGDNKKLTTALFFKFLRSHNFYQKGEEELEFDPSENLLYNNSLCDHYSGSPLRNNQTISSIVSHLALPIKNDDYLLPINFKSTRKIIDVHWVTATSSPCISIFKPLIGIDSLPSREFNCSQNTEKYNAYSMWWKHEYLHRLVLFDYKNRIKIIKKFRNNIEEEFINEIGRWNSTPRGGDDKIDQLRLSTSLFAFRKSNEITEKLILEMNQLNNGFRWFNSPSIILYHFIWYSLSKRAKQPINFAYFFAFPVPFLRRKFFAISTFSAVIYLFCKLTFWRKI